MSERRDTERKRTLRPATVVADGETIKAQLLNLSNGGAMFDAEKEIADGSEIEFSCDETGTVNARIAWVIGKRCGVTFNEVLSDENAVTDAEESADQAA